MRGCVPLDDAGRSYRVGHAVSAAVAMARQVHAGYGSATNRALSAVDAMTRSELLNDAGVSEREAEVLALVGEHLSNAQIAGRLFISVRTVESHVSSLLRRLDVTDRRGLAGVAAALTAEDRDAARVTSASLPSPLTSFVGRVAERAELADVLARHRLVTAVGPGGVGKTRLAVTVAAERRRPVRGRGVVRRPGAGDRHVHGRRRGGERLRVRGAARSVAHRDGDLQACRGRGAGGAGQLRAPHGGSVGLRRTAAHRLPEGDRPGDQPRPVAAALRVRVSGAGAVTR